MVYDPTKSKKESSPQGSGNAAPKKNYNNNSGSYNNGNRNSNYKSGQGQNSNSGERKPQTETVAAGWENEENGSIFVKFNGDEELGIPPFEMYLNRSKFTTSDSGKKRPTHIAFRAQAPGAGRNNN